MSSLTHRLSRRSFSKLIASVPLAAAFVGVASSNREKVAARSADGGATENVEKQLDMSQWHINYQSYHAAQVAQAPITISYVTGYLGRDAWRRKIGLLNLSSKTVRSVEFAAHIHNEERPDVVLAKSNLAPVNWPGGFAAGARIEVDGQDDLANIFQPLLQDGELKGFYHVDVILTKVVYKDGSTWEQQELPS